MFLSAMGGHGDTKPNHLSACHLIPRPPVVTDAFVTMPRPEFPKIPGWTSVEFMISYLPSMSISCISDRLLSWADVADDLGCINQCKRATRNAHGGPQKFFFLFILFVWCVHQCLFRKRTRNARGRSRRISKMRRTSMGRV